MLCIYILILCYNFVADMNTASFVQKPIVPTELYRAVRDSQLIGMSGYSREVPILIF